MALNRENKREYDRRYREGHLEERKAYVRAHYLANKELHQAKCKARYEAKKPEIIAQQKDYLRRKAQELGEHPRTVWGRRWRAKNLEKCRETARASAARLYRADPWKAAIKRAKTILSAQSGLPNRDLDHEIVEAKAMQILVRAAALHPGRSVGQVLTSEERRARKAASWQRWYQANKGTRSGT